jgi:hypothetical protein
MKKIGSLYRSNEISMLNLIINNKMKRIKNMSQQEKYAVN